MQKSSLFSHEAIPIAASFNFEGGFLRECVAFPERITTSGRLTRRDSLVSTTHNLRDKLISSDGEREIACVSSRGTRAGCNARAVGGCDEQQRGRGTDTCTVGEAAYVHQQSPPRLELQGGL